MGANAVTTVPVYVAGEVLTAADLNITNSGIPVFASSVERDAAFGNTGEKILAEGQYAYLEDTNATQFYDGSVWSAVAGGKVAQVQTANKATVFSTTSATFADITDLSVSITPSAASSTVLVFGTAQISGNSDGIIRLVRDATAIGVGTSGTTNGFAMTSPTYNNAMFTSTVTFLDSPATTSATTYKLQLQSNGGGLIYVNRRGAATDIGGFSSITVMEILA